VKEGKSEKSESELTFYQFKVHGNPSQTKSNQTSFDWYDNSRNKKI